MSLSQDNCAKWTAALLVWGSRTMVSVETFSKSPNAVLFPSITHLL
jgi:hypothetical protein